MTQQKTNLERRNLLKALAVAPAAAGVVAVATPAAAADKADVKQSGYKETDHVRSYYASLRGL
ncbi:twin-arginine translocation signal domain-containing protein [Ferrimonas aestuarii]|uniref:Twin-arginine translocation signal domain-containing protein n=1 Tax=Ferrimonas aestuarii TaxID=2569539 RepID=A0A4V5NWA4_9GAMM|nr:twin-arginine translocation signal domain-containing protein [Ferrimonas aestuarii]TKB56166.1 twin-arginine translocation signal domain-containing protein [Ferrimonas aestuarii]